MKLHGFWFLWLSILILFLLLFYFKYIQSPYYLIGDEINLKELNNAKDKILRVGILGIQFSGKTTLKNILSFVEKEDEKTYSNKALIISTK